MVRIISNKKKESARKAFLLGVRSLTDKGRKVAEKLDEIKKILNIK